jgi:hypothetical protein
MPSNGDYAGWGPEDVRDAVNAEYGIYFLFADLDSPAYAAASFSECC